MESTKRRKTETDDFGDSFSFSGSSNPVDDFVGDVLKELEEEKSSPKSATSTPKKKNRFSHFSPSPSKKSVPKKTLFSKPIEQDSQLSETVIFFVFFFFHFYSNFFSLLLVASPGIQCGHFHNPSFLDDNAHINSKEKGTSQNDELLDLPTRLESENGSSILFL
jgi:hypothetical protein